MCGGPTVAWGWSAVVVCVADWQKMKQSAKEEGSQERKKRRYMFTEKKEIGFVCKIPILPLKHFNFKGKIGFLSTSQSQT